MRALRLRQCLAIESCTVAGNHADAEGGGIYFATASPLTNTILNTVIYQNTAGGTTSNWWYEAGGNDVFSVSGNGGWIWAPTRDCVMGRL